MDHQVENAGDVGVARAPGALAHREQGGRGLGDIQQAHGREHHPLQMAAGEDRAAPRGGDQLVRILK